MFVCVCVVCVCVVIFFNNNNNFFSVFRPQVIPNSCSAGTQAIFLYIEPENSFSVQQTT